MITSLALVLLIVLVWLALSLPLAVLIGRCISVGQAIDARRRGPAPLALDPEAAPPRATQAAA